MTNIEHIEKTYTYEDGEIQRVQVVKAPSWDSLDFFSTSFSVEAFNSVVNTINRFQVQKYPFLYGTMVFFHIPEGVEVPICENIGIYGDFNDKNIAASILFKKRFKKGRFFPMNDGEKKFIDELKDAGTFRVLKGLRSNVVTLPFSENIGFMSSAMPEAAVKVNSTFFIMDSYDCSTVYDIVGTPLGLCVKNGRVINLPLYEREALIVRNSGILVAMPLLKNLHFDIEGTEFVPGENCRIYERSDYRITKRTTGTDLVVVGTRVVAVKTGGKTDVPGGGFVLQTDKPVSFIKPCSEVNVKGFEDVSFAIQTGNSIMRDGVASGGFISKFYNIKKLVNIPYPPCFYPLDYENSRAARIAIGADKNKTPCLMWAEGSAKIGHIKGCDSRGASLKDMEDFCRDFGIENAINLDGGGSAQILVNNTRSLHISDRSEDGSETERAVPLGLYIP